MNSWARKSPPHTHCHCLNKLRDTLLSPASIRNTFRMNTLDFQSEDGQMIAHSAGSPVWLIAVGCVSSRHSATSSLLRWHGYHGFSEYHSRGFIHNLCHLPGPWLVSLVWSPPKFAFGYTLPWLGSVNGVISCGRDLELEIRWTNSLTLRRPLRNENVAYTIL